MIREIGFVEVLEGREAEFEAAVKVAASTVLPRSHGFQGFQLHRGIERSGVYTFTLLWDSLEDHTIGFRESSLFAEWRAIIGPFFAHPPVVEHWTPLWELPRS
ncbi:MAG: antibiotic biosynthesis monooxygenase [Candidatus Nanopelagicaceae bacterium]|nr:antibiotic biosynthesis monooxygenase [Candidatus Nanopelagicaceae bacterium]